MELQVSMADGDEQSEITSLYRWLSQDPEVRGQAELSLGSVSDQPDSMGTSLDLINIVLSNSIAAVSMVLAAIALWRQNRTSAPEVHIEAVKTSVTVTVGSASPEKLMQIATELVEVRQQGATDRTKSS